jgi:hypothetical protein
MDNALDPIFEQCKRALDSPDPQATIEGILLEPVKDAYVAPGVLPNGTHVIHAISNPLDESLLALHAYGGDLFATPRSNWDPETHEEIPFDWTKVRTKSVKATPRSE